MSSDDTRVIDEIRDRGVPQMSVDLGAITFAGERAVRRRRGTRVGLAAASVLLVAAGYYGVTSSHQAIEPTPGTRSSTMAPSPSETADSAFIFGPGDARCGVFPGELVDRLSAFETQTTHEVIASQGGHVLTVDWRRNPKTTQVIGTELRLRSAAATLHLVATLPPESTALAAMDEHDGTTVAYAPRSIQQLTGNDRVVLWKGRTTESITLDTARDSSSPGDHLAVQDGWVVWDRVRTRGSQVSADGVRAYEIATGRTLELDRSKVSTLVGLLDGTAIIERGGAAVAVSLASGQEVPVTPQARERLAFLDGQPQFALKGGRVAWLQPTGRGTDVRIADSIDASERRLATVPFFDASIRMVGDLVIVTPRDDQSTPAHGVVIDTVSGNRVSSEPIDTGRGSSDRLGLSVVVRDDKIVGGYDVDLVTQALRSCGSGSQP